jgi:hypothetical protein
MEQISNRALISRLYSSANQRLEDINFDIESWVQWYNAVQSLTDPEKMVYIIVNMNKSVTKGGFAEFYETSFGVFAPETIHVLTEIKANASANIVSDSLPIVNPKELLDDDFKKLVFEIKLSDEQKTKLFSLDIRYDQLHGHENLEDLMGDYLQAYINSTN